MNEIQPVTPISVDNIKSKIHEIRGQKVMLDRDLAELYQVETKVLNQAVKRNIKRFPEDTMFVLTKDEFDSLRSQFVTSNKRGGTRYMPLAFTELGIAMLSSVLSSEVAIQANLNIMRAFVAMRHAISSIAAQDLKIEKIAHKLDSLSGYIEDVLRDQNDINDDTATQLELINQTLAELQAENAVRKTFQERNPVGFKIEKS
ncbi:MAG: ORF6N domain-containing protein [Bacteroidales bacterium]|nr:ORF6N domain-containing protein [Bacteroidales bacterium]